MALKGIAVGGGRVLAPAYVYIPPEMASVDESAGALGVDEVMAQVRAAVFRVDKEMERRIARAQGQGREVLEMQRVMLNDSMLMQGIEGAAQDGKSAAAAVASSVQWLVDMLLSLNDPLFSLRVPDTRDVGLRLCCELTGQRYPDLSGVEGKVILVGADLPPSLLAGPDCAKLAGVVMGEGNRTCHAAILCGALDIPALMGAEDWASLPHGVPVYLDGDAGTAQVVRPEERLAIEEQLWAWQSEQQALQPYRTGQTHTADGRPIGLYGNAFSPETVARAHALDADGVGLFRTEFLYTGRPDLPGEEEQFAVYRAALAAMPAGSVTFRTMDIGGDKPVESLGLEEEPNAFLGYRAIRICLERPELFLTQLRAILRASAHGKAQILFPMISGAGELRRAKGLVRQAMAQLREEGQPFDENIPVGIMIEVPSAAVMAEQLAREADFFSIGSNDLTQYTLACDRMNPKVAHLSSPLHPAVLALMGHTIRAAKAAGIPCSVCGEVAGMPEAVPVLLGLGLEKFSVSPGKIPAVRRAIARCSEGQAAKAARDALAAEP